MRLGLLGPADERTEALGRAARFLHRDLSVNRAVYLGLDGALESLVRGWAQDLVGGAAPDDSALWDRAAEHCVSAGPAGIDAFLSAERERESLQVFESLPGDGTRVIELLGGRVAVMIYDKSTLDEDDIASATLLVFGNSDEPLVKQVGSRWFLSPGRLGEFGVMMLDDREDGVHLSLYDGVCREIRRERLLATRQGRVNVL